MIEPTQSVFEQPFTKFRKAIADKEFLITAEVSPPKGATLAICSNKRDRLKGEVMQVTSPIPVER